MDKLLDALQAWKGPQVVDNEISRRGFTVPKAYRQEMIKYCCGRGLQSDLETYWLECTKERVLSGGAVNRFRRQPVSIPPYRSVYLDEMFATRPPSADKNLADVHPCLIAWVEEYKSGNTSIARELWTILESVKDHERERFGSFTHSWTGIKRDAVPIFREYASQKGFVELTLRVRGHEGPGRAMCKTIANGLMFYGWVDTGGLPRIGSRLPLQFSVSHIEDELDPFALGPNTMSYGADYYAVFKKPENAVFGIYALLEIFDAFASTFT